MNLNFNHQEEVPKKKEEKSFNFIKKQEINVLKAFDEVNNKKPVENDKSSFKFIKSKQENKKSELTVVNLIKMVDSGKNQDQNLFFDLTKGTY